MISRWYADAALLRLGPDTEVMHERGGVRETHPGGCGCPWCSELRAARTGAGTRGITAQEKREAAARAQVTRELADAGAYPYRNSGTDTGEPVARKFSHEPGCGCGCEKPAALVHRIAPAPVLTPEQEIRAALAEFDTWMLHGPQLPAWMEPGALVPEPGRCHECRLGYTADEAGLCLYCKLRYAAVRENLGRVPARSHDHPGRAAAAALMITAMTVAGCILVSLAVAGYPALTIPGLVLLAAGVAGALRR